MARLNVLNTNPSGIDIGLGFEPDRDKVKEIEYSEHLDYGVCLMCQWPRLVFYVLEGCSRSSVICQICLLRKRTQITSAKYVAFESSAEINFKKLSKASAPFTKWQTHIHYRCFRCDNIVLSYFDHPEIKARYCLSCAVNSSCPGDPARAMLALHPELRAKLEDTEPPQIIPFTICCPCDTGNHVISSSLDFSERHVCKNLDFYTGIHKIELTLFHPEEIPISPRMMMNFQSRPKLNILSLRRMMLGQLDRQHELNLNRLAKINYQQILDSATTTTKAFVRDDIPLTESELILRAHELYIVPNQDPLIWNLARQVILYPRRKNILNDLRMIKPTQYTLIPLPDYQHFPQSSLEEYKLLLSQKQ